MVSAAELQAMHQQQQAASAPQSSSAPALDPFPSISAQDPFPAVKVDAPVNGNGNGFASVSNSRANGTRQPDFNSESAFPSLGAGAPVAKGQWGKKPQLQGAAPAAPIWTGNAPVIQRAMFQETFSMPSSEESSRLMKKVMARLQLEYKNKDVNIEASSTRSSTTFVVRGPKESLVKAARKDLTVGLARNVTLSVMIPASLAAYVIGAKGKNLKEIREKTGVNITIPKQEGGANAQGAKPSGDVDYDLDEQISVTIDGDEINARTAKDMISAIVSEKTSRTTQRLTHIDPVFYPFIAIAKGSNATPLDQGDVTIKVPPRAAFLPPKEAEADVSEPRRERDLSIIVSGDREAVTSTVQSIERQVEEMKRTFRTLQISIPKRQHRFLVGEAAQEILSSTSCSIELASIDDPSDNVTIRGPQARLPLALTAAMEKANAVRVEIVDVAAAHRNLEHAKVLLRWLSVSGKLPREQAVQVFVPRPAIVESSGTAQIEIVGADAGNVAQIRSQLETLVKSVPPTFVSVLEIDPLLHRFIIGKKGAGLHQFSKMGVDVIFPPTPTGDASGEARSDVAVILSDVAVIESLPKEKKARDAAVAGILEGVKEEMEKVSKQAADLKTETVDVPAKFHRAILGPNGTTLNAIIGEERLVAVKLGSSGPSAGGSKGTSEEDIVTIRGPSNEVQRVVSEIRRIAEEAEQDSIVNGHTVEFTIDSQHIPHIVGRGGSGVTKLREDLGVRIDFGDSNSSAAESTGKKAPKAKVVIVGRKENVEEAKRRILGQAEKLADETSLTLKVPPNLHGSIIGQGGKYVTRLQDNYAVRINFPSQGEGGKNSEQKSDEIVIKGGKKGVEGAKAELLELIEYEKENNNVITVPVSSKSIARIMGKGGANVNRIRDETDAQIDVDREDGGKNGQEGTTSIRLRGTKAAIAAAKKEILAVAADVDSEASYSIQIPAKFHGQLIGPGGQNLRDIIASVGGPSDSKTAAQLIQFPRRGGGEGGDGDIVTVRGPADLAGKVKVELEKLAKEFGDRVVVGVVVAPGQQRSLMGRIRELQAIYKSAKIIVPTWREYNDFEVSNADELKDAAKESIVKIQGSKADCDALKAEIAESFASNSKVISIPRGVADRLASSSILRQLRSDYGVSIDMPRLNAAPLAEQVGHQKPDATSSARIDDDEDTIGMFSIKIDKWNLSTSIKGEPVSWSLSGRSLPSIEEAILELENQVSKLKSFDSIGTIEIPQRSIPRIVGRGGAGLREIENQTDCLIEIPRDYGGVVIILGKEANIDDATETIEKIARQRGNRD
ncbi:hypothetical protein CBS101457_001891 [Exobasidium rhododendri]|nr:hypothetical protein CBS101457_001891 [Exobasidium rhododendri]